VLHIPNELIVKRNKTINAKEYLPTIPGTVDDASITSLVAKLLRVH
jgi:hypothetical protein